MVLGGRFPKITHVFTLYALRSEKDKIIPKDDALVKGDSQDNFGHSFVRELKRQHLSLFWRL